ncbi:MAG: Ig-like domain-containing protein [Bacilli bacterium]|nr:Ig-like domain-containing protein [Bacilli bacterium]
MKKKAKLSTLTLALLAMTLTGCGDVETPETPVVEEEDNITKISLDKHYASMFYNDKVGFKFNEEVQITPTILPRKAGARKVKWTSSNPNVATVDQNGKVTAVGEGTTEVTISNEDGTVSASSHIVVNNMNDQKLSYCNSRLSDIISKQNKSSFEVPDVITSYETFNQTIEKNGKVVSKTFFTQDIQTSKENAYIKLDIDQIQWKCEDASPVVSSFQYVFYTTDSYESYLYKTSGLVKNYMSVNQSDYIGKGKLTALKAICNNFFVSGDKIIEDNYDTILSQQTFTGGWISSVETNEHFGRMADTPGQLAFDLKESLNYVAYSEDENDLNIPVGTPYLLEVYDRILYENFLVTGKYVEQTATYDIDGDHYVNKVIVDNYYKTGEDIEIPNKDNFSLVDSIFNL